MSAETPLKTFHTVKTARKLSDMVVDQIEQAIISGRFLPGEQLPSERSLAEAFGVSRALVREATRTLQQKGLLEIRHGAGVFVSHSVENVLADSYRLLIGFERIPDIDIFEVRIVLEVGIAGFAAARADENDLRSIEGFLKMMEKASNDCERYIEADLNFHLALARATHNDLFVAQLNAIAASLKDFLIRIIRVPEDTQAGLAEHQAIFEAVRSGNVNEARACMSHHLYRSLGGVQRVAESEGGRPMDDFSPETSSHVFERFDQGSQKVDR